MSSYWLFPHTERVAEISRSGNDASRFASLTSNLFDSVAFRTPPTVAHGRYFDSVDDVMTAALAASIPNAISA
jgi:hypothetical protein